MYRSHRYMLTVWINDPPEELYVDMFVDTDFVVMMKTVTRQVVIGYNYLDHPHSSLWLGCQKTEYCRPANH